MVLKLFKFNLKCKTSEICYIPFTYTLTVYSHGSKIIKHSLESLNHDN